MTNTESHHAYFAWPTIARLQNGKICVGASGYRVEHICPFGKGVIAMSTDNGETYSKPVAVFDTALDDRDVGLTAFGESGLIATSFTKDKESIRKNMPQTQECIDYLNSVSDEAEQKAASCASHYEKALMFKDNVIPAMNDCRKIADELEMPINTVKTKIRRAKAQLLKMMDYSDELL